MKTGNHSPWKYCLHEWILISFCAPSRHDLWWEREKETNSSCYSTGEWTGGRTRDKSWVPVTGQAGRKRDWIRKESVLTTESIAPPPPPPPHLHTTDTHTHTQNNNNILTHTHACTARARAHRHTHTTTTNNNNRNTQKTLSRFRRCPRETSQIRQLSWPLKVPRRTETNWSQ